MLIWGIECSLVVGWMSSHLYRLEREEWHVSSLSLHRLGRKDLHSMAGFESRTLADRLTWNRIEGLGALNVTEYATSISAGRS